MQTRLKIDAHLRVARKPLKCAPALAKCNWWQYESAKNKRKRATVACESQQVAIRKHEQKDKQAMSELSNDQRVGFAVESLHLIVGEHEIKDLQVLLQVLEAR